VVVIDEGCAGGGEGVFVAELLPGPFELLVTELARPDHPGKPVVRCLREDRGLEHRRHVRRATAVARQRREMVSEAGPAVDLDQQLG
jgi:hypothetical protein